MSYKGRKQGNYSQPQRRRNISPTRFANPRRSQPEAIRNVHAPFPQRTLHSQALRKKQPEKVEEHSDLELPTKEAKPVETTETPKTSPEPAASKQPIEVDKS